MERSKTGRVRVWFVIPLWYEKKIKSSSELEFLSKFQFMEWLDSCLSSLGLIENAILNLSVVQGVVIVYVWLVQNADEVNNA